MGRIAMPSLIWPQAAAPSIGAILLSSPIGSNGAVAVFVAAACNLLLVGVSFFMLRFSIPRGPVARTTLATAPWRLSAHPGPSYKLEVLMACQKKKSAKSRIGKEKH